MPSKLHYRLGIVALAALLGACGSGGQASVEDNDNLAQPAERDLDTLAEGEPAEGSEVRWSYEGAAGPQAWGDLSPEFRPCKEGRSQSPIDLTGARVVESADIVFDYAPTALEIVNIGRTVQANVGDAGGIEVDGVRYELVQFHSHAPSEHLVDGVGADLEFHLVHQNEQGGLAVVGVLMRRGAANDALAPVCDNLPAQEGGTSAVQSFDSSMLLPADRLAYRYEGSLTTPPCTEGVQWLVLKGTVEVSADQVAALTAPLGGPNNRPVQPLGNRVLLVDASAD